MDSIANNDKSNATSKLGGQESASWIDGESSFAHRVYQSYEEYVNHQVSKLGKINLSRYDVQYRQALIERLKELDIFQRGDSVLCLGARIGTECKAFIDLGCLAIGIDLNPGEGNRYVVTGDFHDLQFADASVDYVFTNSLDHVYSFDKVIAEVARVLRPNGAFITEIVAGSADGHGREPGAYESIWWQTNEDVIQKIARHNFAIESRDTFSYPWGGDRVVFRKLS
jgi:SAM-dependent methyltransferase